MSAPVPIAAFADARASLWGMVLGGAEPQLALARLGSSDPLEASLASIDRGRTAAAPKDSSPVWSVTAGDVALTLEAAPAVAVGGSADGSLELCTVRGGARASGASRQLDCRGVRLVTEASFESLRLVAAWFSPDASLAVLAVRPPGADGHGQDRIQAALAGEAEAHGLTIIDPRVSTTYGSDWAPRRVGIELWLGESDEAELQFRRYAGEAERCAGVFRSDGLTIGCHPMHAHVGATGGPGVYLLARPSGAA
jgi:hypothetical protein